MGLHLSYAVSKLQWVSNPNIQYGHLAYGKPLPILYLISLYIHLSISYIQSVNSEKRTVADAQTYSSIYSISLYMA